MKTPEQVITELDAIRVEIRTTADRLRDAQQDADRAERDYKREFALVYRRSQGSIRDREQQALLETNDLARARDDAQAVVDYLKVQRSNLELQQTNLQTQARMVDLVYRGAGPS